MYVSTAKKPTPTPTEAPADDPISGGIDAVSSIVTWLFSNLPVLIGIVVVIGIIYGWRQLSLYYLEKKGRRLPPLGNVIRRLLRFYLIEDTQPLITKPAKLAAKTAWLKWRTAYLLLAVAITALTLTHHPWAAWVTLLGTAWAGLRARKIFRIRNSIMMQMFNVAAAECRYPKEATQTPWAYINITQWTDVYRPGKTIVTYPAGYQSEDYKTRDKFERNFGGTVSDEHSFLYEWESARNRVTCTPSPFLPSSAPYPGVDDHPWDIIPLGVKAGGEEAVLNLQQCPHTLVAGPTGSGKSVAQRTILMHALQSPEWRIVCIDPKRVELGSYAQFENVLQVATMLEEQIALLESCEQEMMRRYDEMAAQGVNHFKDLADPQPALMIMVDEVFALLSPEGIKSEEGKERDALHARGSILIGSIARLGRAAGVFLVLATQRPDATVLKGETKNNLDARIACGRMDVTPSQMVLDSEAATRLPLIKGRSIVRLGGDQFEYQGYFLPMDQVPQIIEAAKQRRAQKRLAVDTGENDDDRPTGKGKRFGFRKRPKPAAPTSPPTSPTEAPAPATGPVDVTAALQPTTEYPDDGHPTAWDDVFPDQDSTPPATLPTADPGLPVEFAPFTGAPFPEPETVDPATPMHEGSQPAPMSPAPPGHALTPGATPLPGPPLGGSPFAGSVDDDW